MAYTEEYRLLQKRFNQNDTQINIPELNLRIYNVQFQSSSYYCLPGVDERIVEAELAKNKFSMKNGSEASIPALSESLDAPDMLVAENNYFKYILLMDSGKEKANDLILLFHGLNEKNWAKYLNWGVTLNRMTGKAVILFPITFHMNRCPEVWSNRRIMNEVSIERKRQFPSLCESSFANAAISTRLSLRPQRFFFSGFQTYYDLMRLLKEIRKGKNPHINPEAHIDIFSYSIGAFLSEILFFSGSDGLLNGARLCMFCGGTTTDNFRPIVKTIMDSEAFGKFHDFYAVNFEREIDNNSIMKEFYRHPLPEALAFRSLLSTDQMKDYREAKLEEFASRIFAIPLRQDQVIPSVSVERTLRGERGNIPVQIETVDFPYKYTHESPFPVNDLISKTVDECFEHLFSKIANFLS